MHSKNNRGAIPAVYVLAVAVLGLGAFLFKPKFLDGDSKRAKASAVASARVEQALTAPAAVAAASLVKIGEANAAAPASPARDFIGQEVPVGLANLPPPDAAALIAAEQRRAAVMEGQRDEARRLYAEALKRADEAGRERTAALAAQAKANSDLETTAAARLAAEHEGNMWKLAGLAAFLLWGYVKLTHLSPGAVASAVADIRAGHPPIAALDTVATGLQQRLIAWLVHGKSSPPAPPAQ